MKGNKGSLITDPLAISSKFNDFFINVDPSLAATIPSPLIDHNGTYSNSFFISPTSLDEIIDTISKLKTSNREGINGINVSVIKASAELLAAPLSNICNFSFSTGSVPDKLKISRVIPIYKSDNKTNFTNYTDLSQSCLASLKFLKILCIIILCATLLNFTSE